MKLSLKNLASIQTGIYEKPDVTGEVVYLQAKDFNEDGRLHFDLPLTLNISNKVRKNLLRDGDVLVNARGIKNFAVKYSDLMGMAVASSTFMVIRIKSGYIDRVLPDYLIWLINHAKSQGYLKVSATGSSLTSISKGVLEELEVLLPPIEDQEEILKLNQLWTLEKQKRAKRDALMEQLIQHVLYKTASQNL